MNSDNNYWTRRLAGSRPSRRTFLGGAAAGGLGAATLGLVGCGDDNAPNQTAAPTGSAAASSAAGSSSTAAATPKPGGTYTNGLTGPFAGADPHNSVYGGAGIVPEVYNYLIRNALGLYPDKPSIQDLAESQKLEADNITWVFKLRPDVKIAANDKGVPERALDSSDVLASWQRISDEKSGSNGYAFANSWIDKIDAPDGLTFRLILKEPYAWTEANVGDNLNGAIVPKEWLANTGLKKAAVGGGPFVLTELVEGSHVTMVKNPTYYKKDRPYLDTRSIRDFADQATYRTAFVSGQIDSYGAANPDEAKKLDGTYLHEKYSGFNSFWMRVNAPPWNDARARRAVSRATKPQDFIDIVGHKDGEPIGPLTYAFGDYALSAADLQKYQPYDPADAKKLFEAAGISEFDFSYPTSSNTIDYVTLFVRQMQAAGVKANAQALDAGTWLAGYYASTLTASLSLNQLYKTPDSALRWYQTGGFTGNGHYYTGFSDPDIDSVIKKAATTMDETERKQAYHAAQIAILQKDPAFFNFFGMYLNTVVAPYIHNYPEGFGSVGYAHQEDIWTSKV